MNQIETQLRHATTLIELLHPMPSDTVLIEITGLARRTKPIKRYFTNVPLAAAFAVEISLQRFNVFVSVNPRSAMSGFEHDVPFVSALPLDLQVERTDIDKVADVLAQGGIPPTMTAVSGYGAHMYLCIEPTDRHKAKLVAERLVKLTRSDAIFNGNRIMRCAGSWNWKKDPPRWCHMVEAKRERRYTLQHVEAALDRLGAPAARTPKEGIQVPHDAPVNWNELRTRLSQGVLDLIDTGERNAYSEKQITNSEADWVVVCTLVREGCPDGMIHWIYETQPIGGMKYRSAGVHYLNQTIHGARRATADLLQDRPVTSRMYGAPKCNGGSRDSQRRTTRNF